MTSRKMPACDAAEPSASETINASGATTGRQEVRPLTWRPNIFFSLQAVGSDDATKHRRFASRYSLQIRYVNKEPV
jgi:hypothetical protein